MSKEIKTPWTNTRIIKSTHDAFVYMITNKKTNEFYIGLKHINARYNYKTSKTLIAKQYCSLGIYNTKGYFNYLSSSTIVLSEIKKYGISRFKFEILKSGRAEDMIKYESKILTELKLPSNGLCYNKSAKEYGKKSKLNKFLRVPKVESFKRFIKQY